MFTKTYKKLEYIQGGQWAHEKKNTKQSQNIFECVSYQKDLKLIMWFILKIHSKNHLG